MNSAVRALALFALVVAAAPRAAQAQATAPASPRAAGQPGRAAAPQLDGIEFTDAQRAKLREIQQKHQAELIAIRNDAMNGGDRDALWNRQVVVFDRMTTDVRAILTPEQRVVFDRNMAAVKAMMQQRRQGPGASR